MLHNYFYCLLHAARLHGGGTTVTPLTAYNSTGDRGTPGKPYYCAALPVCDEPTACAP
jgi:hypothetical protein